MISSIKNSISLLSLTLLIPGVALANPVNPNVNPIGSTYLTGITNFVGNSGYTQFGLLAQKVGNSAGYYEAQWGPSADLVWTTLDANGDIGNQGVGTSNLTNWIKTTSGSNDPLYLVSSNDELSGSKGTFNFANNQANFVAVHYGQNESLFYFENGITQFNLDFELGEIELSNYKAYSNQSPSAVPVPGAFWLFSSAMLGFFGFSKRKNS